MEKMIINITNITNIININTIFIILEHSFNFFWMALPYILFGFILSTIIKMNINSNFKKRILHNLDGSIISLLILSFIGAILPLCSASGIPVANALNSKNANLGMSMAFIVSAASINPITIMLTLSMLGYEMTIIQILASLMLSILVGLLFYNEGAPIINYDIIVKNKNYHENFFEIFIGQLKKFLPSMVLGFLISGIIITFISKDAILLILSNNIYSYFYVSILRVFIFLCPHAMIPIIKSVAIEGIQKGLIISFLISAPTLGLPLLLTMKKGYGLKITLKYFGSVVLISALIGMIYDFIIR
ncbi:permease [Methanococcus aeolicus Nankai-3]|uniref:Permease n=2 Tax=Methanococcus aeolicus TaxID=42879 RepID=A6UUY2_META3|nr:permease [Methanococcus aeolicus Nankai-3]